jgi:hypothetical protein
MGSGAMAKALPILWVDDGDAFGHRLLPWKRLSKGPLPLARRVLPECITLTFWSGDDGVDDVVPLAGGVALEGYALLVCGSGRCRGKEGGDLVEDSSYWCRR